MGLIARYSLLFLVSLGFAGSASAATDLDLTCPALLSGEYAVILQPVASSGRYLTHHFTQIGIPLVYIIEDRPTRDKEHPFFRFDKTPFAGGFTYSTQEDLVEQLKRLPHPPLFYLPGDEAGIEVLDFARDRLEHPYRNDLSLSEHRYHKGMLADRLRERGLTHVNQAYSHDVEVLLKWQREDYGKWPVIVKPVDSAGTDAIALCHDEGELRDHFAEHIGTRNMLGRPIRQMLVQEVLDVRANEFVIDTMSLKGEHRIFMGGRRIMEQAPEGAFIVAGGEAIDLKEAEHAALVDYALAVLDALGWENGPAHLEIVRTPQGYKILDFNGRIGGTWPSIGEAATGVSLFQMVLDSVKNPAAFLALPVVPTLEQATIFYTVRGHTATSRVSDLSQEEVRNRLRKHLPSFHHISQMHPPGAHIGVTRDVLGLASIIELTNADPHRLAQDLTKLVSMDRIEHTFVQPYTAVVRPLRERDTLGPRLPSYTPFRPLTRSILIR